MQFLLRFHRFRRLLDSATAALSSRIDAHTLAGPQRMFAFPQDVVSQASKASPEMSNYLVEESRWFLCDSGATRRLEPVPASTPAGADAQAARATRAYGRSATVPPSASALNGPGPLVGGNGPPLSTRSDDDDDDAAAPLVFDTV